MIGAPQRTFYGNQFGNTFLVFVHFRIPLWVPEVGGPIDPDNEAHDLVMSVFGGMSKGEHNRIKIRVRTAMSSQAAAPVVQRIFTMDVDSMSDSGIAAQLTREGIPCPSAHDATRNPHRRKTAWQQGTVRAILLNPRYTGYQGQQARAGKRGGRPYALRGRVRCSLCGRKMQPATIQSHVYYHCEFKEEEAALHPDVAHPRTVNLREDLVCQALDQWIARAFAPDRLTAVIEALTLASVAASTTEIHTPEQAHAGQVIKDCERRLRPLPSRPRSWSRPPPLSPSGSTRHNATRKPRKQSSTPYPPSPGSRNRTSPSSKRSLRGSKASHSASRPSAPIRKAASTKPSTSPSPTTTQQGPRP
ncbi:recombinase family protein [Streptomyces sp. NPDC055692]|uniref:recombinase family protein n=1 Tax=Streptomyces sp. NPDC055692 TaxID=3155683 RepID=UPI00343EBE9F